MNLNLIRPKTEIEDFLFSINKNCETLIEQTHTEPPEILEFKITKPRQTFSLKPSNILGLDSNWMVGLTSLEVYKSIFNINTTNKSFERCTVIIDAFSFEELKDELEEIPNISDITPYHLQRNKLARVLMKHIGKISEKSSTDGYIILLMGYAR